MPSAVAALAAAFSALALAGPPQAGVLVPGRSLGGLHLGMTAAQVRAAWGPRFGACRGCANPTWYYTYKPFLPQGAGIEFRNGRAAAIFTLWSPTGWRTTRSLAIGDPEARVTQLYGTLPRIRCGSYAALVESKAGTRTAFAIVDGKVWGFAISLAAVPACR
jgi:hypothetical protein